MTRFFFDLETFSSVDIRTATTYAYVGCPMFDVLMLAWAVDDSEVTVLSRPDEIRRVFGWAVREGFTLVAHNATFERLAMGEFMGFRTDPERWDDTAARAAVFGLPRGLSALAQRLGVRAKDDAGAALIRLFCTPGPRRSKVDGALRWRAAPEHFPEDWEQFKRYCATDVEVLRDVDKMLPALPESERRVWCADQRINDRGLGVDVELAHAAAAAGAKNVARLRHDFHRLTGVDNPGSTVQMTKWLESAGVEVPNLQAATVKKLLEDESLDSTVREGLVIRQEISLSSGAKFARALSDVSDDHRVRGVLRYHSAHTGRWGGVGVQPQNLPRASVEEKGLSREENAALVESLVTRVVETQAAGQTEIKALVRSMFRSHGGRLIIADYSAIEARVVAWLSGQESVLRDFRELDASDDDSDDIYTRTARQMGPQYTRQDGKVAVLALGYGGGVGALRAMGATGSEDELDRIKHAWREANPRTVGLWRELENTFWTGGTCGRLKVLRRGSDRFVRLPSGRVLCYRSVKHGVYTPKDPDKEPYETLHFAYPKGGRWPLWGGTLTENVTQAVARDVLASALVRLDQAGWPVVAHVHDEVIVDTELGDGEYSVDALSRIMCELPRWAEDLPIAAAGYSTYRYRKD